VGTCAEGDHELESPLDLDVANALKRMWKVEEGGALKTWQPQVLTGIYMLIIVLIAS
jgi:hypothetical protein